MVGSSLLSTLLSDRKQGDQLLRDEIGRKTADWGVAVISVEIRDIGVPPALQDAMSRQAQAERERLARVLLGQAEQESGAEVRRGGEHLRPQPGGPATARHEHHLRNHQGARRDHPDSDHAWSTA